MMRFISLEQAQALLQNTVPKFIIPTSQLQIFFSLVPQDQSQNKLYFIDVLYYIFFVTV